MTVFSGKTAVVTGSRGIGESIVKNLWVKGANIIIVSASESCEKLASSLSDPNIVEKAGSKLQEILHIKSSSRDPDVTQKAVGIRCDLSSATAASELAEKIVETAKTLPGNSHGKIDYLILCAGIMTMKSLEEVDEQTWNQIFGVNVVGPVFLTKELAPSIADEGRILFFSTSLTVASTVTANYLPYIASKGAIEQTVRALSKDNSLVSRGISAMAISPGPTATDLFTEGKSDSIINMMKNMNPYKQLGDPDEIAVVVDSILLAGRWLNGTNVRANGGSIV